MKFITSLLLFITSTMFNTSIKSQTNVSINIVTASLGIVAQNSTLDLNVQITNTGSNSVGVNKVSTSISVPSTIALILSNAQQTSLPAGWVINSNDGETIDICNGSDVIPSGVSRNFIVKLQGTAVGGPSTIAGSLDFTNGVCGNSGFTLAGDNQSDNSSTTTITVTVTTPLTLLEFSGSLLNCKPYLKWITSNEINTAKFEIEKSSINNNWIKIDEVNAQGNSSLNTTYTYIDQANIISDSKFLYRVKMIDRDGSYKYSPTKLIWTNCTTSTISIYPNPIENGNLNINVNGILNNTLVTLKSLNGQLMLTEKVNNGANTIDVHNISSGIYILALKDKNGNIKQSKVIIQN